MTAEAQAPSRAEMIARLTREVDAWGMVVAEEESWATDDDGGNAEDARRDHAYYAGLLALLTDPPSGWKDIESAPTEREKAGWNAYWQSQARCEVLTRAVEMAHTQLYGKGKKWRGDFCREEIERAMDASRPPCMDCRGTGCYVDPETGPMACQTCEGFGSLPAPPALNPEGEKT